MARISPVCGFSTTIAPRFAPESLRPQSSACWASFCSLESIVSTSESPACGVVVVDKTRSVRPVPSFSTSRTPYTPRRADS
jgi:hypothetical protein